MPAQLIWLKIKASLYPPIPPIKKKGLGLGGVGDRQSL
jgi:hypothetical protein